MARGCRGETYHHPLLPRHALLAAAGVPCESFFPGPMALAALSEPDRLVVQVIVAALGRYGPRCAPLLTARAAQAAMLAPQDR